MRGFEIDLYIVDTGGDDDEANGTFRLVGQKSAINNFVVTLACVLHSQQSLSSSDKKCKFESNGDIPSES